MGGFHQMQVFQRVLFKRYNFLGFQGLFVGSETIASGSVSQAFEGRHYYCSMSLYKVGVDVHVRKRVEDITNKVEPKHSDFLSNLSEFRRRPPSKALEHVTNMKEFTEVVTAIFKYYWEKITNSSELLKGYINFANYHICSSNWEHHSTFSS